MNKAVCMSVFLALAGVSRMLAQAEATPMPTPNDVPAPQASPAAPPAASDKPCPDCAGGLGGMPTVTLKAASPAEDVAATLAKLEQDWGEAIVRHDVDFLERTEADVYTYTGPDGIVSHKADEIAGAKIALANIESFSHRDLKFQVYGDTAIVMGATTLKGKAGNIDLSGDFRWTDVFVRKGDRWQVVASQATTISKDAEAAEP